MNRRDLLRVIGGAACAVALPTPGLSISAIDSKEAYDRLWENIPMQHRWDIAYGFFAAVRPQYTTVILSE